MIRANYIDCPTKAIFDTWTLPQNANDKDGDIGWTTTVYIKDTGEIWMYGKLWGGSYSEVTDNSIVLSIGGVKHTLSLNGHTQPYTSLTGSTEIPDLVILSTGILDLWTLKTLGKNAFSNEDYLLADSPAVSVKNPLTIKYGKVDATLASYDGSNPVNVKLLEGDNINFILGSEGELIINSEVGSDTTNTSGATNLPNTKLFIIGAKELSESPQTYSNINVYIGADNLLYSNGKEVSTSDHNHDSKYLIKSGDTMSGILNMSNDIKFIKDKYVKYNDSIILGYNSENDAIVIANSAFATKIYSNNSNLIHVKEGTEYTILDSGNYINTLDNRYVTLGTEQTITGSKTFTSSSMYTGGVGIRIINRKESNATGLSWGNADDRTTTIGGIGMISVDGVTPKSFYMGWGTSPWDTANNFEVNNDFIRYKGQNILHTGNYTSTLDTRYVKKGGDTMTGVLTINNSNQYSLVINSSYSFETAISLLRNGTSKGVVGYHDTQGTYLYNRTSGKFISNRDDGNAYFDNNKIWHAGNDGAGSGLDAGLLCSYDESKFYRSAISTVDGETSLSNIPATRSGSYTLTHSGWSGAAHIFYSGGSNSTFGFMLPGGSNKTVKVISCRDGKPSNWEELGTLAFTTSNVSNADNAANADKLDGVHLNGIFTAFTTNGNNTRLTIGGVTKDLTVPYASNSGSLSGLSWSSFNLERVYTVNTSSLDKTKFYPVIFSPGTHNLIVDISSRGAGGSDPYNTNRFRAIIHANGWDDSGKGLTMLNRFNYTDSEITIGAIGYGNEDGARIAIWVRGGLSYTVKANYTPELKTSNYTVGTSTFTVGTNLDGGTNTKVSLLWKNDSSRADSDLVIKNGNVASATKLQTARTIWGQSFDGQLNISGNLTGVADITSTRFYLRGSNTNPLLRFSNDTVSAAYLQLTTGGVLSMDFGSTSGKNISLVYSNGYVGIGTTSPSYKLQVEGKIHASDEISTSGRIVSSRSGVNTVSSLTSLPVTKDVVVANLSSATNLTLASAMTAGDCITIIVNPSSSFEQPLPTGSGWSSLDGDSISFNSGKLSEISILCYAAGKYSVSCKVS